MEKRLRKVFSMKYFSGEAACTVASPCCPDYFHPKGEGKQAFLDCCENHCNLQWKYCELMLMGRPLCWCANVT